MLIHEFHIKHFRCFENFTLNFLSPVACIRGSNGSGKSSLLEALHYACYLRSFRTHLPKDMIHFNNENFFIKLQLCESLGEISSYHELNVGFSKKKRLIKIDQQPISSYKELSRLYRVITLIEDDVLLIKGSPEVRRLFMDQALFLEFPEFAAYSKRYKHIMENRNALLCQGSVSQESYVLWTEQLWHATNIIQEYRCKFLFSLALKVNDLLQTYFDHGATITFNYQPKKQMHESCEDFLLYNANLFFLEKTLKRSLFGAHLDDFSIEFCQKNSRSFASRGQQKLVILLIKIAQIQEITSKYGQTVFLLDDFMNDLDQEKAEKILTLLLQLKSQLIFTSPTQVGYFDQLLDRHAVQWINLTP